MSETTFESLIMGPAVLPSEVNNSLDECLECSCDGDCGCNGDDVCHDCGSGDVQPTSELIFQSIGSNPDSTVLDGIRAHHSGELYRIQPGSCVAWVLCL